VVVQMFVCSMDKRQLTDFLRSAGKEEGVKCSGLAFLTAHNLQVLLSS
jgi:hypothetical protein